MSSDYFTWLDRHTRKAKKAEPQVTENQVKPSEPIRLDHEDRNASTSKIKMVRDAWERITRRG